MGKKVRPKTTAVSGGTCCGFLVFVGLKKENPIGGGVTMA